MLRYSDIPSKIVQLIFLDKNFYLDRVTGFAVEVIVNMIGGGSEVLNSLDATNGSEYEQETAELRLDYVNPL